MSGGKKSFMGGIQLKEVSETTPEGSFSAVFSRFNVIDHDGDITFPGAFQEGAKVPIAGVGHNWDMPVIGVGIIHQDAEKAWVDGLFNLKTQGGREHYEAVKFSHEHGVNQEYSYAYDVDKKSRADVLSNYPGAKRGLEGLTVKEVSPVLMGAGIGTGTMDVKGRKKLPGPWPANDNDGCPVCGVPVGAHGPGTLAIHKELFSSVYSGKSSTPKLSSKGTLSAEDRRSRVSDAVIRKDKIEDIEETGSDDYSSPWIMETYDDYVIVSDDGDEGYLKIAYTLDADGTVTLGDITPVERIWAPKKFSDQGAMLLASLRSFPERTKSLADLRAKEGRTFSAPNRQRLSEIATAAHAAAQELEKLLSGESGAVADETAKGQRMSGVAAKAKLARSRAEMLSLH